MVNFFRSHIANCAEIAFPLTELLGRYKPDKLNWGEKQQAAFDALKQALISRPVLYPPNREKGYQIMADSSLTTLSAILLQEGDKEDETPRVISYASRKLLPRERNYPTVERELLSIVFALAKFHNLVYGKKITVKSDHRSLMYFNSMAKTSPRLARWILAIQEYDIEVEYIKGDHQLADVLTRVD